MKRYAVVSAISFSLLSPNAMAETPKCVPETFEESVRCLGELMAENDLAEMSEMPYSQLTLMHFGLGMWIRNSWIHGEDRPVAADLRAKGFRHADDMSSVITEAFWAERRGCTIELDAYRAYYQGWWAAQEWVEGEPDPETKIVPMSRPEGYSPDLPERPRPDCPFPLDAEGAHKAGAQ